MTKNNKAQKYFILTVYIVTLLCSSCEEVIFLYNSREVGYLNDGLDICFIHNIINEDRSVIKIIDTFNNYNKTLISKVKNNYQSFQFSLNITKEIALPLELPKPYSLFRSITFIETHCSAVILKVPKDIFRPPKSIESSAA